MLFIASIVVNWRGERSPMDMLLYSVTMVMKYRSKCKREVIVV
ncbi:hypothetical protein HMPREF3202_00420 [Prevotella bivia]|uniref:Uncharacterized protein n=1 Tax=Prevotella bivia TaxID=28125 RepID=A0A137T046_9BACT|nr:hypothetical protein HMPREF3202_00420 [Prevotella bivia]